MSQPNPVLHAFFLGRAFAEVLGEKIVDTLAEAMSELSKFDAEQRNNLEQIIEEVQARAAREAAQGNVANTGTADYRPDSEDLQATIDELRAEIANLKTELKAYRNQNA